ncbi:MAG: hypothetical protein QXX77_05550 [Candidatus Methanosuratincola sp.]|jgi:hypothetical protein
MKWSYRVLTIDELFPEQHDHDIAVSKDAAARRRSRLGSSFEEALNKMGGEGWELVSIIGEFGVFKKVVEQN